MITTATDCPNDVGPCLPLGLTTPGVESRLIAAINIKPTSRKSPIHPLATFSRLVSFMRLIAVFSRRIRNIILDILSAMRDGKTRNREKKKERS